jgi:short-subunit dehydrogenase
MRFAKRYGPWAVVVGASEGIGAEYVRLLAQRGLDLVLVSLPQDPLDDVVRSAEAAGRTCVPVSGDVGHAATLDAVSDACNDKDVGLLVVNAAQSEVGAVLETDEDVLVSQIRVNCEAALRLVRRLAPAMVERGHGGVVLTSSLSSVAASPWLATYAATKSFLLRFGESVAEELRPTGVDVTVLMPGPVDTPGFRSSSLAGGPAPISAAVAASAALDALGRRTVVVPGGARMVAQRVLLQRLLPARVANRIMATALRRMYR